MKDKHKTLYMDIAGTVAKQSHATRLKVGAVCVKDDRILSVGYNGTPPDFDNTCEVDGKTRPEVIHAEMNAIFKMTRDGQSAKGASMFITHAPCIECAKGIKTSGFSTVYYRDAYRSSEGIDFLLTLGVDVIRLDPNEQTHKGE